MITESLLDEIHPGEILLEDFMKPSFLTAQKLATYLGVAENCICDIIYEKKPITADIAYCLALFFKTEALLWMRLQNEYDARKVLKTTGINMNIKPFNLEQMLAGKPVQIGNDLEKFYINVNIFYLENAPGDEHTYRIIAYSSNKHLSYRTFTIAGRYRSNVEDSKTDLHMTSVTKEGYVIANPESGCIWSKIHNTEAEAETEKITISNSYLIVAKIIYEV